MSETLRVIQPLVRSGKYQVSQHGAEELNNDGLLAEEVLAGIEAATVVEDYPRFAKGPCVLVLQKDARNYPIHVLWGLRAGTLEPAVLITCYRPSLAKWTADFLRRIK